MHVLRPMALDVMASHGSKHTHGKGSKRRVEVGEMLCTCMSFRRGSIHLRDALPTISRLLEFIGLLCRIKSLLQGSFAKETYNFPTNRSHPIPSIHSQHTERTMPTLDERSYALLRA